MRRESLESEGPGGWRGEVEAIFRPWCHLLTAWASVGEEGPAHWTVFLSPRPRHCWLMNGLFSSREKKAPLGWMVGLSWDLLQKTSAYFKRSPGSGSGDRRASLPGCPGALPSYSPLPPSLPALPRFPLSPALLPFYSSPDGCLGQERWGRGRCPSPLAGSRSSWSPPVPGPPSRHDTESSCGHRRAGPAWPTFTVLIPEDYLACLSVCVLVLSKNSIKLMSEEAR